MRERAKEEGDGVKRGRKGEGLLFAFFVSYSSVIIL